MIEYLFAYINMFQTLFVELVLVLALYSTYSLDTPGIKRTTPKATRISHGRSPVEDTKAILRKEIVIKYNIVIII